MYRKSLVIVVVLLLALVSVIPAAAGKPNFSAAIYADGVAWGTKGLSDLPAPNANNVQSFDKIFVFTNAAEEQLPVAEAAPGNPAFNGGRWWVQMATWTEAGIAAHGYPLPILKSYGDVMLHAGLDHLDIVSTTRYFECPLLPVK